MSMYSWGCNAYNQLGFKNLQEKDENEPIDNTFPTPILVNTSFCIEKIICGWNHTLFLSGGLVYASGLNYDGELGISNENTEVPERITCLATIITGSCGDGFSILLNERGQVYSFGKNHNGQLGQSHEIQVSSVPRVIGELPIIRQVSCGKQHTLALSADGHVFSWGSNEFGQVGINSKFHKYVSPQLVRDLSNCPIIQICAGGHHSLALTISGTIFAWGKNSFGQLGLGDQQDRLFPTKIQSMNGKHVRYISCGEEHSVLLTSAGRVYTFGCGSSGQLGHNEFEDQFIPKMVVDLMGTPVTQIACGRKHTLAHVMKGNKLYSFGLNVKGQLGIGSYEKARIPMLTTWSQDSFEHNIVQINKKENINCYFEEDFKEYVTDFQTYIKDLNKDGKLIKEIFSGGLQSFALVETVQSNKLPVCHSLIKQEALVFLNQRITDDIMRDIKEEAKNSELLKRHLENLVIIFSSQACLNASFLKREIHENTSAKQHGLQLLLIRSALNKLCSVNSVNKAIIQAVTTKLIRSLFSSPKDIEAMRVFLIIPELPFFFNPEEILTVLVPFADAMLSMQKCSQSILVEWWSSLPASFFERLVQSFKKSVVELLDHKLPPTANQTVFMLHAAIKSCMMVLERLNQINEAENKIPFNAFYIEDLTAKIPIKDDFLNWLQYPNVFAFCQYPFILDIKIKVDLLMIESEFQRNAAIAQTLFCAESSLLNPILILDIRRSHIVEDTLSQILSLSTIKLKKPLKVRFRGEEAEDAGGVKKEFFLLLMKEILDPKYGMFDFYTESQVVWFKRKSFEDADMYMFVGMICGLAIYNSTMIDFPFPLCLYKKLLKKKINLDDFRGIQHEVAKNLQYLLDYDGDDFKDVFEMNFQIIEESFGELIKVNLVPHGESIPITIDNREMYVNAYIDYMINTSVEKQYQAFAEGFFKVCRSNVLNFFHPQELMNMMVGCQDYDCNELERVAEYKGEYYRQHPVIENFWKVFYEFSRDKKKKFLAFLTGSDKVSIFGIRNMKFVIQSVAGGDKGDHLPVAHTCFNLLDLPKYPTYEIMKEKLNQAVENYEGFGLV
ncbi:probable E3 ubiquitin-protein ligase HERC4 isoform X1 [Hydra vulgaris]|uniref:probable E3 ubiquitin-protein ligase HERC4 isoform X1 n=1 Tax=Hydra vulgaris TaxID=6087 RepID=UPI001F5F2BC7|nr:probable E3 ubiquitin-protein ligase HERC4 [Hydra vulgaris]